MDHATIYTTVSKRLIYKDMIVEINFIPIPPQLAQWYKVVYMYR
jgi:hypothetical protein